MLGLRLGNRIGVRIRVTSYLKKNNHTQKSNSENQMVILIGVRIQY